MMNLRNQALIMASLAVVAFASPVDFERVVTVTVVASTTAVPDPAIITKPPETTITVYSTIPVPTPTASPHGVATVLHDDITIVINPNNNNSNDQNNSQATTTTTVTLPPAASPTATIPEAPAIKHYKPWCSTNQNAARPRYWIHWPDIPNDSADEVQAWCGFLWQNLPWRTCPVDKPNGACGQSNLTGGGLMWEFTSWRDCSADKVQDAWYLTTVWGSFGNITCSIGAETGPFIKPDDAGCGEIEC